MSGVTIAVGATEVSGIVDAPSLPRAVVTLAHGAGADMRHAFMAEVAARLAARGLVCLRHQFPYSEGGRRRIDPKPLLLATIRATAEFAAERWPALPRLVGGKSMGGRMATLAAAEAPLPGVCGLVLLGFPLHPRGAVSTERADHLSRIGIPSLFVHGTRDELGAVDLLRPCISTMGAGLGQLHVIEHADHGFGVLRRSGRTAAQVLDELAAAVDAFVVDVTRRTP